VRILLVNMPWALIDVPSLALGILRRATNQAVPEAEVEVLHANLDYVDWLTERREFTYDDYYFYSLSTYFSGVGDWVFSSALYDDPEWRVAELLERVPLSDAHRELSLDLHRTVPEYVADLTARILAYEPDLVGFTSTFQQNIPALAVARAIKQAAPRVLTAMGGANCDGAQGEALHRNFDFLDFVIRGEGEASFPRLLLALRDGASLADVPGLCRRGPDGASVSNPMDTRPLPPSEIVTPDYDGYFERLEASAARHWLEPKLVVEGARGCWWGEKHHCTFCGLNGSFMEFRSKSPAAFWDEIVGLVTRHQVLDMFVVDNILDMGYLTSLLPRIIESGYDLRMQYEIKSNLRGPQLETLADAGLVSVQPGIESLSSRVLKIMDKGVTGYQNVRMLRDAADSGLSVVWNYLYGFPAETADDYLPIIEQIPALHHLPPPDVVARIAVERFSPYFNRPELGFADLRPDTQYLTNYDLPESELLDLAYVFSAPSRGVDESVAGLLGQAVEEWNREFPRSRLSHTDLGDEILLFSRRRAFAWSTTRITEPAEVSAFRLLDQPHTVPALTGKLTAAGFATDAAAVEALLGAWLRLGVVFAEAGHYVQIAPASRNQDLMRIDNTEPVEEPSLTGAAA
jgi:ribosomal peptide maturation radical SAM protein 1